MENFQANAAKFMEVASVSGHNPVVIADLVKRFQSIVHHLEQTKGQFESKSEAIDQERHGLEEKAAQAGNVAGKLEELGRQHGGIIDAIAKSRQQALAETSHQGDRIVHAIAESWKAVSDDRRRRTDELEKDLLVAKRDIQDLTTALAQRDRELEQCREALRDSQERSTKLEQEAIAARSQEALASVLRTQMQEMLRDRVGNEMPDNMVATRRSDHPVEVERAAVGLTRESPAQADASRKRPRLSSSNEEASSISQFFTRLAEETRSPHAVQDDQCVIAATTATLTLKEYGKHVQNFTRLMDSAFLNTWFCCQRVDELRLKAPTVTDPALGTGNCRSHGKNCMFIMITLRGNQRRFRFYRNPREGIEDRDPLGQPQRS